MRNIFIVSESQSHIEDLFPNLKNSIPESDIEFLKIESDFSKQIPQKGTYALVLCLNVINNTNLSGVLKRASEVNRNAVKILYLYNPARFYPYVFHNTINRCEDVSCVELIETINTHMRN